MNDIPPLQDGATKATASTRFGGIILVSVIAAAFVGQALGLVAVLRHSSQIEAKQVRVETLDANITRLGTVESSANTQAAVALKESEAARGRMKELQNEEQTLQGRVAPMREMVRQNEQSLNSIQAEVAKLTGQRDAIAQALKELEPRRQNIANETAQLEGRKDSLVKATADASEKLARLEREITQAQQKRDEFAVVTARIQEIERQRGDLSLESQSLKKQVEDARSQLANSQAKLATAVREEADAQKAATAERADVANLRSQRDSLAEEMRRLSAERTTGGATLESLQTKLASAKADLTDANRQVADARRSLDAANAELATAQAQKRGMASDLESLRAENKRLDSERGKASAAVDVTRESLASLEAKLTRVQTTLSQDTPNTEALVKLREAVKIQIANLNQELGNLTEAAKQIKAARETIQPANPK